MLLFDETPEPSRLIDARAWIDDAFAADTVAEIVERLRARPEPEAAATADLLGELAPTALAVTLEAVRRARELPDLRAALAQEYGLVLWFATTQPDLVEGIRAQVIDKDRSPKWQPADDRRAVTGCRGIRILVLARDPALGLTEARSCTPPSRRDIAATRSGSRSTGSSSSSPASPRSGSRT